MGDSTARRLTALDATFLELEDADESAHMHIGSILVFEPLEGGRPPSREELALHFARRLPPRYAERLSSPHTGGLSWPAWERDPEFDLHRHIGRHALPAPGGERELSEWSGEFFSQRLDRRRPLWEVSLLEGLEGGRWGLANKTHHCMIDGVGSVDVGTALLDLRPEPETETETEPEPHADAAERQRFAPHEPALAEAHGSGPLEFVSRAWEELRAFVPVGAAAAALGSMLHPHETLTRARAAVDLLLAEEVNGAPHTSLNVPIGTRRRYEVLHVPLEDMRTVRAELGGTVNDVALAMSASGLRALLLARGDRPPAQGLRAMVPMNIRPVSERMAFGNRISSLFLELPVAEPDTLERYLEVVACSVALKAEGQAVGSSAVLGLAALVPPLLHAEIARALYATRLFNVTITNVPGPQMPLYALGSRLREVRPLVPLAAEHAVGVAILSFDADVYFGVIADRDVVPELDVMLEAMRSCFDELLAAARPRGAPARRGTPARRSGRASAGR